MNSFFIQNKNFPGLKIILLLLPLLGGCIQDPNVAPTNPKIQAVKNTLKQNVTCAGLGDLYWSIGDSTGRLAQGQVGGSFGANTRMAIFSASKLIFAAYVLQKTGGALTQSLIQGLNFTSGYIGPNERVCNPNDTVSSCFTREQSAFDASKVGTFVYASGHMQKIAASASDMNLGALNRATLANEIMSVLGADLDLKFEVNELGIQAGPILAGAMNTTPVAYEKLLTKIVANQLSISSFLGSNAVQTPIANIRYSLGHWVEQDGAFSSVGALGFLPWIDSTKQYWGVIARVERNLLKVGQASANSQACGQKIRAAYITGVTQL